MPRFLILIATTIQEIRLGDVEVTRALFERATCLSLPPKKMKVHDFLNLARHLGSLTVLARIKIVCSLLFGLIWVFRYISSSGKKE